MVEVVTIDAGSAASLSIVMTPEMAVGTAAVARYDSEALMILRVCVERGYANVISTTDGSGTIGTGILTGTTSGGIASEALGGIAISTVTTFGGIVKEGSTAVIDSSGAGSAAVKQTVSLPR